MNRPTENQLYKAFEEDHVLAYDFLFMDGQQIECIGFDIAENYDKGEINVLLNTPAKPPFEKGGLVVSPKSEMIMSKEMIEKFNKLAKDVAISFSAIKNGIIKIKEPKIDKDKWSNLVR